MERAQVKKLLKLLEDFRDKGMASNRDKHNIEHTIEEVEDWLAEFEFERNEQIRQDEEN